MPRNKRLERHDDAVNTLSFFDKPERQCGACQPERDK
jgi:hypothetical protein